MRRFSKNRCLKAFVHMLSANSGIVNTRTTPTHPKRSQSKESLKTEIMYAIDRSRITGNEQNAKVSSP